MSSAPRVSVLLLLAAGMQPSWAAKWEFSESVLISEAYTDNVRLVEKDKESRWVTIVSPNVLLRGTGRRLEVELAAALQFVSGSDETFYPKLRASAHSELVKQRFFLDALATANTQTINPLRPAGSPINQTGNLTTTYTIDINPYYLEHFGDLADLRLDYSYRRDFYSSGDLNDRDHNDFYFRLNSGRAFSAFSWGFFGRYEKTSYDGNSASDTTFKSLDARFQYHLTSSFSPYFSYGREWNTYNTSRARRGGDKWLVGAVWSPNPRISIDGGYGYRFFGHYPFVNLSYRHRRSVLRLGYDERLESGYVPLEFQDILATTDLAGNPVNPFADDPAALDSPTDFTDLYQNGAYVDRRFKANYLLTGKRTSLGINARYSDKTYQYENRKITEWRAGMTLRRQLKTNLSADLGFRWYRTEDETDFQADTWDLRFGISRSLGTHSFVRFSYSYSQRDSNRPDDDYKENRFAVVLNTTMVGLAKKAGLL